MPEPALSLFEIEERPLPTGRRELSLTPKVLRERESTKVAGVLLEWARAAVEHRRRCGEPEPQLFG